MSEVEDNSPADTVLDLSQCTSIDSLKKFKVTSLKTMLTQRGLSSAGKKDELVKRLWEWVQAEEALRLAEEEDQEQPTSQHNHTQPQKIIQSPLEKAKLPKFVAPTKEESSKGTLMLNTDSNSNPHSTRAPSTKDIVIKTSNNKPESEKIQERAKKFASEDAKKQSRATRFGLPTTEKEVAKKKQRAERFNLTTSADDIEKMKQRKERFGETSSQVLSKLEEGELRKRRAERFGS